jgi:hypothetical protein
MTNKLIVPNAELVLNQLKNEIAAELGIEIHSDMKSRDAGKIGGEITKRLIELGKQSLMDQGIINSNVTYHNLNQGTPPQHAQLH